jgi:hypothetical protein
VTSNEHDAKKPSGTRGFVATLYGFLSPHGSSAPSSSRRRGVSALVSLLALLATLALTATPALAAPEPPKAEPPTELKSTSATLQGILSPKAPGELGAVYQFVYRISTKKECKGAGELKGAEGLSLGVQAEPVNEPVSALKAATEYAACLVVHNAAKTEEATSPPVTFKTALPPEPPTTTSPAASIKGTTATLEGTLNPLKAGEAGTYEFAYQQSATECASGAVAPEPPGTMTGAAKQAVSVPVTNLEPLREYTFCLIAINNAGESATGPPVSFKTLAVAPEVIASSEKTSAVTPFAARLEASINPENQPTTSCVFEYGETLTLGKSAACEPASLEGFGPQSVAANIAGLSSATTYHYRVLVTNPTGESEGTGELTTLTAEKPIVEAQSVTGVTENDAKLEAKVNPNYQTTTYTFEYATEPALLGTPSATTVPGSPPAPALPAVFGAQTAGPTDLANALAPGTTYTYRVLATNATGTTPGPNSTFTTTPKAPAGLPDGRVYELVSPVASNVFVPQSGSSLTSPSFEHGVTTERPAAAAANGEAVAYAGEPSVTGGDGGFGAGGGNEFLATRSPGGGWTSSDLQVSGRMVEYEAFSSDLSVGVILAGAPLTMDSPPEGYEDLYSHPTSGGVNGEYRPFYTGTPPNRGLGELSAVKARGLKTPLEGGYAGGNSGTSAVPAFSHLLFEANDALKSSIPEASDGGPQQDNLYDSVGEHLYLVNVLPDGKTEANASFGSFPTQSENLPGFSHVISTDGSRIFWTALEAVEANEELDYRPKAMYVRENDTSPQATTVQVDASTLPGTVKEKGEKGGGGRFWTASSDGARVFFTDERQLTPDATAAGGAPDLYEYDVESGQLTDLTVDGHTGEHADVQGVVGASEEGSYVYFVADGVLASDENANKEKAREGEPNLYVRNNGATKFIAALSALDGRGVLPFGEETGQGENGDWQAAIGSRTAEVTPDGQSLVFMSNRSLTGYDNRDKGESLDEVFLYEANAGELRCVSCNPAGVAPVPTEFDSYKGVLGAYIPIRSVQSTTYQPQVISEDGSRVFFDSGEPLVAQDTNGWLDVYEWERDGTGSCRASQGCIYLLSGGTSPEDSYLLGASANGNDVFIISRAQLLVQDRGDNDVVYDARVGGVHPPATVACSGAGCQGVPPAPPMFATPSSVTSNGIGNFPPAVSKPAVKRKSKPLTRGQKLAKALKACKKEPKKKRSACEKQARKRYAPVKKKGQR